MPEIGELLGAVVIVHDEDLDRVAIARHVRRRRRHRRLVAGGLFALVALGLVTTAPWRDSERAVEVVGNPGGLGLRVESGGGWGPTYTELEIDGDGNASMVDPGFDGFPGSQAHHLRGRLNPQQIDRLRTAAAAAGLDVALLDLADPVPNMSISDAGTTTITIDVSGTTRHHRVYALGSFGERQIRDDPSHPVPVDRAKIAGRVAIIDFLNDVRAEILSVAVPGADQELTDDERAAIRALAAVGLRGVRADSPPERGATIWAPNDGFTLRVQSSVADRYASTDQPVSERVIRGITVRTLENRERFSPERDLFPCGDLFYDVSWVQGSQAHPFGYSSNEEFLDRLIEALGCE